MSLENQIAELTAAGSALVEMFKNKKADIDKAVATALAAVPLMRRDFFVDAAAGDDAGEGSQAAPFLTFKRAVDACPTGGYSRIFLRAGQTHDMLAATDATQKHLEVFPYGDGIMPVLRAGMTMVGANQSAASLRVRGAPVYVKGVKLVTSKDLGNGAPISTFSSFIERSTVRGSVFHFAEGELELRDGSLMSGGYAGDVALYAATITVTRTGNGKLMELQGGIGRLSLNAVTLPAGDTIATLVTGIVRDAAGVPRNLTCNTAI